VKLRRSFFDVLVAFAIRRVVLGAILVLAAVLSVAAAAPDSTTVAVNIITVLLMLAAPFLPLAQFHLDGPKMVLLSMGVAFIVALGAQLITGDLRASDLQGGVGPLFLEFGKLWGIQQGVFQLIKDHPTVGPLLTTAPILAVPAKPAVP
jgi:hypothetical protein